MELWGALVIALCGLITWFENPFPYALLYVIDMWMEIFIVFTLSST